MFDEQPGFLIFNRIGGCLGCAPQVDYILSSIIDKESLPIKFATSLEPVWNFIKVYLVDVSLTYMVFNVASFNSC